MIKRFLIILILIINLPNLSFADDIRDFQIEGMSIGDSFLDFMNESEIKNKSSEIYYYKSRKYVYYFYPSLDFLKTYDGIQITIKGNDKDYKIHGLDGVINFKNDINSCHKKQNEIKKELDEIFISGGKKDTGKHPGYKDSTYIRYIYYLSDGAQAELICYDMSKKLDKKGKWDSLYITLSSEEFKKFLTYEAYK